MSLIVQFFAGLVLKETFAGGLGWIEIQPKGVASAPAVSAAAVQRSRPGVVVALVHVMGERAGPAVNELSHR